MQGYVKLSNHNDAHLKVDCALLDVDFADKLMLLDALWCTLQLPTKPESVDVILGIFKEVITKGDPNRMSSAESCNIVDSVDELFEVLEGLMHD